MATITIFPTSVSISTVTGGPTWSGLSIGNINSDNGVYMTAAATNANPTDVLEIIFPGAAIPVDALAINSVTVNIGGFQSSAASGFTWRFISLEQFGDTATSYEDFSTQLPTSHATTSFTQTFGQTWSISALNTGSALYFALQRSGTGASITASIDFFSVTIDYTPAASGGINTRRTLLGVGR
ncbi:MAG: hypothetical protein VKJ04_01640 [Vampirovibrionales bacterium]|nr:hypothetical protein [Vampirovibrionales bacterium]